LLKLGRYRLRYSFRGFLKAAGDKEAQTRLLEDICRKVRVCAGEADDDRNFDVHIFRGFDDNAFVEFGHQLVYRRVRQTSPLGHAG